MPILLLWCGLFFFTAMDRVAYSATCNETCSTTSDCDSTCPVCIGVCVSCYELGNASSCLDAGTGGSTNCQWDGQNCKAITDVPTMPKGLWLILLVPLAFAILYMLRIRKKVLR